MRYSAGHTQSPRFRITIFVCATKRFSDSIFLEELSGIPSFGILQ